MSPCELIAKLRDELWRESAAANAERQELKRASLPMLAAAILTSAEYYLTYGPKLVPEYSAIRTYEKAAQIFADREARGELETCRNCHTTMKQSGKRWNRCDVCGVMLR